MSDALSCSDRAELFRQYSVQMYRKYRRMLVKGIPERTVLTRLAREYNWPKDAVIFNINRRRAEVKKYVTERNKKTAFILYRDGYTQSEIAYQLGISQPTVSRILSARSCTQKSTKKLAVNAGCAFAMWRVQANTVEGVLKDRRYKKQSKQLAAILNLLDQIWMEEIGEPYVAEVLRLIDLLQINGPLSTPSRTEPTKAQVLSFPKKVRAQ